MTWRDLLVALLLVLMFAFTAPYCAAPRQCTWQSEYRNTLQHDIHREWVCK